MESVGLNHIELQLLQGDITKLQVDAIVNAANESLLGGGGVDGAIHRAAGAELLAECRTLGGCPTGQAKITKGYKLPAKWVIHTVGPVWRGGSRNEASLLKSAYKASLELAARHNLKSIAFPCISTGVYHFPKHQAAQIALGAIKEFSATPSSIIQVALICFGQEDFEIYGRLLKEGL